MTLVGLVLGCGSFSEYASEYQLREGLGFRSDPVRLLRGSLASSEDPSRREPAWKRQRGDDADRPGQSPGACPRLQLCLESPRGQCLVYPRRRGTTSGV